MSIRVEDVAAAGTNLESSIRENLSLILSDELDFQGLLGAGAGSDLIGIFERLADPRQRHRPSQRSMILPAPMRAGSMDFGP